MNQFCPATMIARTTLGTHNPRISAQTVTHGLREIGERPPYTMYVLYAAFLFWPSILHMHTSCFSKIYATTIFDENKSFDSLAMLEDAINYQLTSQ